MNIIPFPAPPASRFTAAADAVTSRTGTTVAMRRRRNYVLWAVHARTPDGDGQVLTGPVYGEQPLSISDADAAHQIAAAVKRLGCPGPVFADAHTTTQLLRRHTGLEVSDLCAPVPSLAAARDAIEESERRIAQGLVLACDASRGQRTNFNGTAWVLSYREGIEPLVGAATDTAKVGGIRAGELAAMRRGIQAAVGAHPCLAEGHGSLKVLTDSTAALELLQRVREDRLLPGDDSHCVGEARRILGSLRETKASFEWVRGHAGHELNETADRLAVMARRNMEMGIGRQQHQDMVERIRQDLIAGESVLVAA